MINIVLFGAPGCGKGTQAQRLKAQFGIDHVSTGEVIREHIRRGTELGRSMESYIAQGKLAPDEIVIGMIEEYVASHKEAKGCIFDGFPRTTVQAEAFDAILSKHGLKVDIMVDIHVPEEELVRRILLRGKDSGRADDASEEVIRGRFGLLCRPGQVCVGQRHRHDGRGVRTDRLGNRGAGEVRTAQVAPPDRVAAGPGSTCACGWDSGGIHMIKGDAGSPFFCARAGGLGTPVYFIRCFLIHSKCPRSVASEVQCSLIGVTSASLGPRSTL